MVEFPLYKCEEVEKEIIQKIVQSEKLKSIRNIIDGLKNLG